MSDPSLSYGRDDTLSRGYRSRMTRNELAKRIAEVALKRGRFTLRSGRTSSYYLDKYLFSSQPDILDAIGDQFAEKISIGEVDRLAGADMGGIPLVTVASLKTGLPCVFIRNQVKDYGTKRLLEGALNAGDRVVIVEDVATTGGQVLEAAEVIRGEGGEVSCIISTVDRLEGARERIEESGFVFDSLFTVRDLGIEADS